MAAVTQCDVCNNVVKHEQSMYIEIYTVKQDNSTGRKIHTVEACMDCYAKLCDVLKLEVKK